MAAKTTKYAWARETFIHKGRKENIAFNVTGLTFNASHGGSQHEMTKVDVNCQDDQ